MRGKDDKKLFEVFQPGVMDELSFWQKLCYWFKNVYWYLYKKQTLLALFFIVAAIALVHDVVTQVDYDISYIMVGDTFVTNEVVEQITNDIAEKVGDINVNGKVDVGSQMLPTGNNEELALSAEDKLSVSLADDEIVFYILDKRHMESLAKTGAFEDLSYFGIEYPDRFCINLTGNKWFSQFDVPEVEGGWYIGIKKYVDTPRFDDPVMEKKYYAAADILKEIIK